MSSTLDPLAPSFETVETVETTKEIILPLDARPFEITTSEKRKREGGRVRSRVWQHFTKLEKRPGEREECRCNYCGNLYVCSSKSGTTHLNRHIFEGGCPKYKPTLCETQNLTSYTKDDLDDDDYVTPLRVNTEHSMRNFSEQGVAENFASELAQLKEENAKLRHERDDLAAQKTSLEQLIVTMATETIFQYSHGIRPTKKERPKLGIQFKNRKRLISVSTLMLSPPPLSPLFFSLQSSSWRATTVGLLYSCIIVVCWLWSQMCS